MDHFKEVFNTVYGPLRFYFNSDNDGEHKNFHVSVIDKRSKAFMFFMQKEGARWIIAPQSSVPIWISDIEEKLGECIKIYLMQRS